MEQYGSPSIIKGTADAVVTRTYFTNKQSGRRSFAHRFIIKNTGATNALRVYLPGNDAAGALDFITVAVGAEREVKGPLSWIALSAAAATTTYEIMANVS